jgi:hypothetical protein
MRCLLNYYCMVLLLHTHLLLLLVFTESQLIRAYALKLYVVWKIRFTVTAVTAVRRNRTVLLQIWSGEIGYGIWYENYTAVKGKGLWLVNTIVMNL